MRWWKDHVAAAAAAAAAAVDQDLCLDGDRGGGRPGLGVGVALAVRDTALRGAAQDWLLLLSNRGRGRRDALMPKLMMRVLEVFRRLRHDALLVVGRDVTEAAIVVLVVLVLVVLVAVMVAVDRVVVGGIPVLHRRRRWRRRR